MWIIHLIIDQKVMKQIKIVAFWFHSTEKINFCRNLRVFFRKVRRACNFVAEPL